MKLMRYMGLGMLKSSYGVALVGSFFLAEACIKAESQGDRIVERPDAGSKSPQPSGGSGGADQEPSGSGEQSEGGSSPSQGGSIGGSVPVGTKTDAPLIQGAHFYYNNDQDQKRQQTFDVSIPVDRGPFKKIILTTRLSCPRPACDSWDRVGSFGIETPDGQRIELHRFVTPYGVGVRMVTDITDFAPILRENTRFWVEIDTWSGPQRDGGRYGGGWLFDAQLALETGTPDRRALQVIPVLKRQYVTYGRPQEPTERSANIKIPPPDGSRQELRNPVKSVMHLLITGHGQGNTENCAEFCPKNHFFSLGEGSEYKKNIWRTNCAETVTEGRQRGTYQYSRAGWCPGAGVSPWLTDLEISSEALQGDEFSLSFRYRPDAYTNRADGGYNDQGHTLPQYLVSGALILFAP